MSEEKVGWIGLGNIGLPMARTLQRKGYHVIVVGHLRREPVEVMKRDGAGEVSSPRELAKQCNVIFSMVFDKEQTEEVIFGNNGLWQELGSSHTVVVCSTLTPDFISELAERAKRERGAEVLDAPVSGGPWGAEAGTLSFMVGGSEAAYKKCRRFFEAMGKNIFYTGKIGTGQAAKLANNLMSFVNVFITSEAVSLAAKAGLDTRILLDIAKVSTGDNYAVRNWETLLKFIRNYPHLVGLNKDTVYALEFARRNGLHLPVAEFVSRFKAEAFPPELTAQIKAISPE
jgi:3-hydroxyisobutyrate dehydrogenase-like beta-hydroxyacid dehydrogenase